MQLRSKKHTKREKRIRIKMHFRRYLTRRKTLSFLEKQRRKVKHPPLKAPTTSFYHWPACVFYQRHFRMKRSNKGLRKYRSVLLGLQTDKSAYSNIKAIMSLHSSLFGRRSKKADLCETLVHVLNWAPSWKCIRNNTYFCIQSVFQTLLQLLLHNHEWS